jgi:hypothetical protein
MTETAIVTSVQPDDPLEKVVTSDGQVCEEMEVSIRDESGSELERAGRRAAYPRRIILS